MMNFAPEIIAPLITPDEATSVGACELLRQLGFEDPRLALQRLHSLCKTPTQRSCCLRLLPALLDAFAEAATPDASLVNFQRFVQAVPDSEHLFTLLSQQPRTVEILVKLFVGSQFLTEILLRNPHQLEQLTEHKRLAEFKSRADFIEQGEEHLPSDVDLPLVMDHLRRFQQGELLRLAACDKFGLLDLKTVTLQLSLLADAIVQISLNRIARSTGISLERFVVLAFGKLGGEELNYSSDVDLVFVCEADSQSYWNLGQQLTYALNQGTSLGFLYRVDLRLRPWGDAGPLVALADAYVDYIGKQGQVWEKQALLKARPIAGNLDLGQELLQRLEPFIFAVSPEAVRKDIWDMKQKIERGLARRGKLWGDVKSGPGGIRDIEFLAQYLQMIHGKGQPAVRSANTLEGLIRLAEYELIFPDEYRRLSGGYLFLRTVEHSLQLMHNRQEHRLPAASRSLDYLAGRLDYPDAETFLQHYEQHTQSVREIFERTLLLNQLSVPPVPRESIPSLSGEDNDPTGKMDFPVTPLHKRLIGELGGRQMVRVAMSVRDDSDHCVTIAGVDGVGSLSVICGLLFVSGYDIVSGTVLANLHLRDLLGEGAYSGLPETFSLSPERRLFINEFHVRRTATCPAGMNSTSPESVWPRFEQELNDLLLSRDQSRTSPGELVRRVAEAMERTPPASTKLLPVQIDLVQVPEADAGIFHIHGEDVPGFLYELTNAIALSGLSIRRMTIQSTGNQVVDTLHVVDQQHRSLKNPDRVRELRAAIVLIKHFTHLLPDSPNPEAALLHFQEFLKNLFRQPDWLEQLSPLRDSEVLSALATLLGNSDFLWDDFLRLQHENLFPVVTDVQGLQHPRDLNSLQQELKRLLAEEKHLPGKIMALNAFKDREMMRTDMRHILGLQSQFGKFGFELTAVAEAVVSAGCALCEEHLQRQHGHPADRQGNPVAFCLCALGKFGGRELGYASDIELIFLYSEEGQTTGPHKLTNADYFHRLVMQFQQAVQSRRKGIFEVDLRLRPFGNAGNLAVSLEAFQSYFGPQGAAWPYERQALVKLRPVAGDSALGARIVQLRDEFLYRGEPFDLAAMRAMREKQNRQLVRAGTFHAKLSPGGLVDCEYLIQGLQITFGALHPAIRDPNTRAAMKALEQQGFLTGPTRIQLRDAYRFWRRVIDALRMVRGDASDLTIPPEESKEFVFLARRLGYRTEIQQLRQDLERHSRQVIEIVAKLGDLFKPRSPAIKSELENPHN